MVGFGNSVAFWVWVVGWFSWNSWGEREGELTYQRLTTTIAEPRCVRSTTRATTTTWILCCCYCLLYSSSPPLSTSITSLHRQASTASTLHTSPQGLFFLYLLDRIIISQRRLLSTAFSLLVRPPYSGEWTPTSSVSFPLASSKECKAQTHHGVQRSVHGLVCLGD